MATVGTTSHPTPSARRPRHFARLHSPHRRTYTAQAFITTTSRQPDHRLPPRRDELLARERRAPGAGRQLGIVAPTAATDAAPRARLPRSRRAVRVRPGQGMPLFPARNCWNASQVALRDPHDYEAELLQTRTGENLATLAHHVEALVVTRGARLVIHTAGAQLDIPAVRPRPSSTPPAAAMPIAAASCMASPRTRLETLANWPA